MVLKSRELYRSDRTSRTPFLACKLNKFGKTYKVYKTCNFFPVLPNSDPFLTTISHMKPQPLNSRWQTKIQDPNLVSLAEYEPRDLARALLEKLSLTEQDWHRLKSNRRARAQEQVAAALVFLLSNNSEEAQLRLNQAIGWLDRSITAPPCPDHSPTSKHQ